MFGIIEKKIIALLASILMLLTIKNVSLSNQIYEIKPTLINLHPNECNQELQYYLFTVKLDKCAGSCNSFNDLSNKVCVSNKTKDLHIHVFNMITGKNE